MVPIQEALILIARGYRRVSNKHCRVARIDRPDWVWHLAEHLRRAPADFYVPGEPEPSACWADFYRRGLTKDVIQVAPEVSRLVKPSGWDPVGYVPNERIVVEQQLGGLLE